MQVHKVNTNIVNGKVYTVSVVSELKKKTFGRGNVPNSYIFIKLVVKLKKDVKKV